MCLAGLSGNVGQASDLPAAGEVHRSTMPLLGKPVPLPPGDWIVLGQGYGPVSGPSPGSYGAIGGVMLAQQRNGIVESVILAHSNVLPVEAGWGPAGDCRNIGALYATGVRTRARNLACAYVVITPTSGATLSQLPAWASGRAEAARRGWQLPGAMAVAGVRAGDRRDVVDVRYAWAAEAAPAHDRRTDIHRAAAGTAAPLRLRARVLAPWVVRTMTEIENRIEDPLAPMADLPWPGAITRASEAPPGTSRWQRRLGQAVSNRAIQASLAAAVGFVVTGNPYAAGAIAAWHTLSDGVGGHLVEFGWEWEGARPAMDFVADATLPAG